MRELTNAELDLISGGWGGGEDENEDIVVTGSPYPPFYPPYDYPPINPPTYTPVPYYPGSPPTTPVDNYPADWNYQRDFQIDAATQGAANAINAMPDVATIEYSAFIYQLPDGTMHTSTIVRGNETNTGNNPIEAYNIPAGGRVVGDIHSHPLIYPGYSDPNLGAVNADYGDIRAMQSYHDQTQDPQYRSYILHNGYVSEYDWVQNQAIRTGPDTTIDPNAVRGGFYPDLG